jgi:intracellular sulfur oxidation DsrE/DsrF family protein
MAKVLSILENGFRATLEEQDDTVVWFSHVLKGAGADMTLLLRGNAVCMAVRKQDASGLAFGAKKQTRPPKLHEDVSALAKKGVTILAVEEDVGRYGLKRDELLPELELVPRVRVAQLIADHDRVWCW